MDAGHRCRCLLLGALILALMVVAGAQERRPLFTQIYSPEEFARGRPLPVPDNSARELTGISPIVETGAFIGLLQRLAETRGWPNQRRASRRAGTLQRWFWLYTPPAGRPKR